MEKTIKNKTIDIGGLEKLFLAKRLFHKERGKLLFEKKIEILVELQKLANDIKSISGKKPGRVWKI